MFGQGRTRKSVAAELGIDPASVSRWRREADFKALEQKARDAAWATDPTVRETLQLALVAVNPRTGAPDHQTGIQAARALAQLPPDPCPEPTILRERIFMCPRCECESCREAYAQ